MSLNRCVPKIREFFTDFVGPRLIEAARDDESMAVLSELIYRRLPFQIRWIVREKAFTRFCLTHRDKLITGSSEDSLLLGAPSVGTMSTPPPLPPAVNAEAKTDGAG